ncbi:hypothetical protein [Elizabethkingia miricola]|uniref:SRPBCC family protein n=1 Tax=Elizabethkingia miricola TaxID=172045 RepID=A0ABD5B628_ELIMR|nr:hypothetical protein [Elizabethkingia miricola]MDQ8748797.1 hypothetical protein [Elizabethkingia miricola]NHQ67524.1 hypothetical protein [Elizabethkingia miricola]NHQ72040.1 hypothetical protein [Elizabethkingia miricola]NHQ78888.1 hypothetical protein [Elizabethkingia miricola]OPB88407.1 hypothetical protein BAS06_14725 [Elizabethkingia miricola]
MKVINIHKREIRQPKSELTKLFNTLATDNDMILATDKWSPMKLDNGLQVGSRGGHGPIKYFVTEYQSGKSVTFQFELPGFNGFHRFDINELEPNKTEISHIIDITTTGSATLKWALAIRWLHDAYIEDAFDKVENHFTKDKKNSKWSWWVKLLRKIMKPKKK